MESSGAQKLSAAIFCIATRKGCGFRGRQKTASLNFYAPCQNKEEELTFRKASEAAYKKRLQRSFIVRLVGVLYMLMAVISYKPWLSVRQAVHCISDRYQRDD
ncbi:hypothetical protein QUF90_06550 [Desulfococcaceae bacterium HSG9]|nr:hypothetical protein [Desulfococcaceae bacterium HSG9]